MLRDEVALGVFTHRTMYLPGLLGSLRKIGDPACTVVCADGPINTNMERLWRALQRTTARYWVFLDDDIEFLGGDVLGDCVKAMVRNRWAGCSIFSTFDVEHKARAGDYETWRLELLQQGLIEERDAGWMTGYFMLVDRDQVGDIGPDMNLPDPCTAIDTSYSVEIRARGLAARVWFLTSATTRKKRFGRKKRSSTRSSGISWQNGACSTGIACSTRAVSSSGRARPTGAGRNRSALMSESVRHGSG